MVTFQNRPYCANAALLTFEWREKLQQHRASVFSVVSFICEKERRAIFFLTQNDPTRTHCFNLHVQFKQFIASFFPLLLTCGCGLLFERNKKTLPFPFVSRLFRLNCNFCWMSPKPSFSIHKHIKSAVTSLSVFILFPATSKGWKRKKIIKISFFAFFVWTFITLNEQQKMKRCRGDFCCLFNAYLHFFTSNFSFGSGFRERKKRFREKCARRTTQTINLFFLGINARGK